jgi:hypothetical protein
LVVIAGFGDQPILLLTNLKLRAWHSERIAPDTQLALVLVWSD